MPPSNPYRSIVNVWFWMQLPHSTVKLNVTTAPLLPFGMDCEGSKAPNRMCPGEITLSSAIIQLWIKAPRVKLPSVYCKAEASYPRSNWKSWIAFDSVLRVTTN
jgi:hypothetical protein